MYPLEKLIDGVTIEEKTFIYLLLKFKWIDEECYFLLDQVKKLKQLDINFIDYQDFDSLKITENGKEYIHIDTILIDIDVCIENRYLLSTDLIEELRYNKKKNNIKRDAHLIHFIQLFFEIELHPEIYQIILYEGWDYVLRS